MEASGRVKTKYHCNECGREYRTYDALCRNCGKRDTLQEVVIRSKPPLVNPSASSIGMDLIDAFIQKDAGNDDFLEAVPTPKSFSWVASTVGSRPLSEISEDPNREKRRLLLRGNLGKEVSRVLGGGIVNGTVVLVGGDPGIGKSTLLIQIAGMIAGQSINTATEENVPNKATIKQSRTVLYVSAEESAEQLSERAERLNIDNLDCLYAMTETKIESILTEILNTRPSMVIIDSIQAIRSADASGGPGSVSQVRECTILLSHCAKTTNTPIFIVGHVTKTGDLAGPKMLEHIVDVVIYLEGARSEMYRMMRGVKNRYGTTDEIGIFEMEEGRLIPVENPNEMLLRERSVLPSGISSTIAASMDGARPMLLEIQALCTPMARIKDTPPVQYGVNPTRLYMIAAILRRHVHCRLERVNLLVNVVGGVKLNETAGDLAIAVAVASAYFDKPIKHDVAFIGELGLGGELRPVVHLEKRLSEVAQLGLKTAIVPSLKKPFRPPKTATKFVVHECRSIGEVLDIVLGREVTRKASDVMQKKETASMGPDENNGGNSSDLDAF